MIQKIKEIVRNFVVSKMDTMSDKQMVSLLLLMVVASLTIGCVTMYFYICALVYVGGLMGIGNYFLLVVCVLTFCFTVNGRNYAVIQDDTFRSDIGGIIFVATMVIYLVF